MKCLSIHKHRIQIISGRWYNICWQTENVAISHQHPRISTSKSRFQYQVKYTKIVAILTTCSVSLFEHHHQPCVRFRWFSVCYFCYIQFGFALILIWTDDGDRSELDIIANAIHNMCIHKCFVCEHDHTPLLKQFANNYSIYVSCQ